MATTAPSMPAYTQPATLPQPDPLGNLIDFGNLHKVLAYILENLRSHTDRLNSLESNVTTLNSTTATLGDSVATLRNLILNLKPGGSEQDIDELKEQLAIVSGRVDTQTKEIGAIVSVTKEQSKSIGELETSTSQLQTLMPTKADAVDLALKANKSTTDRHEREIEELQQAKLDHDARIKILENGLKRISQAVDSLVNDEFKSEAIRRITDLENQVKFLTEQGKEHGDHLSGLDATMATKAAQQYVDAELEALLAKLRELELALSQSMKGELKRFERDVMIYVADQLTNGQMGAGGGGGGGAGGGGGGAGNASNSHSHTHTHFNSNTAAGKMHFRCLTCDNPRENVPGAQTFRYNSSSGQKGSVAHNTNTLNPPSDSRLLEMQLGDQIYLHGTDGGIYRGRADPVPLLTPGNDLLRLTAGSSGGGTGTPNQSTARSGSPDRKRSLNSSRPASADPTRSAGRDRIDPNSGRRNAEMLSLPMHHNSMTVDEKESISDGAGTSRNLFPSPNPKASSRPGTAGGNSSSRAAISSQAPGLLKSGSSTDIYGGSPTGGKGALGLSALGHSASKLSTSSRPSTASNAGRQPMQAFSDAPTGGHVLMGKPTMETKVLKSKSGVEIVQDAGEDS